MDNLESFAVIFDLDGTLLDSMSAYLEITSRACDELGWPAPRAGFMREVITLGHNPVVALFGSADEMEARTQLLNAKASHLWQKIFQDMTKPFPDALLALSALQQAGLHLAIVTDSNDIAVSQITDLPDYPRFDTIVTGKRASARKPSPAGIELALNELGIAPDAAIYIGDSPADIEAACAAGVRVIGITNGPSRREDLEPYEPECVIDALSELPNILQFGAPTVYGSLMCGDGEAVSYLALPWVRAKLESWMGSRYYPGTVNLNLSPTAAQVVTKHSKDPKLVWYEMGPEEGFCRTICHPVMIECYGHVPISALTLVPEVPGYPERQLELICKVHLRSYYSLEDGDMLTVHFCRN